MRLIHFGLRMAFMGFVTLVVTCISLLIALTTLISMFLEKQTFNLNFWILDKTEATILQCKVNPTPTRIILYYPSFLVLKAVFQATWVIFIGFKAYKYLSLATIDRGIRFIKNLEKLV